MNGLGTNQPAKSAIALVEVLQGRLGLDGWDRDALAFAETVKSLGHKG